MLQEFKKFIMQGNLIEIAIGLILALKVAEVVDSLTVNIITPIIAAIGGEPDFSSLTFEIGDGVIRYGSFLNSIISFVIVGFVLFLIVKAYNSASDKFRRTAEPEETPEDVALLREIRDSLRGRQV